MDTKWKLALCGLAGGVALLALYANAREGRFRSDSGVWEAIDGLKEIKKHMESFRASGGDYISIDPQPAADPSWDGFSKRSWGDQPCDPACAPDNLRACRTFACIGFKPAHDVRYTYACTAIRVNGISEFTCAAIGDLDADGRLGGFIYGTNSSGGTTTVAPLPELAQQCALTKFPPLEVANCNHEQF